MSRAERSDSSESPKPFLPVVSQDTIDIASRDYFLPRSGNKINGLLMELWGKLEKGSKNLHDFLAIMGRLDDQVLGAWRRKFGRGVAGMAYMLGALMAYDLLRRQFEADKMNQGDFTATPTEPFPELTYEFVEKELPEGQWRNKGFSACKDFFAEGATGMTADKQDHLGSGVVALVQQLVREVAPKLEDDVLEEVGENAADGARLVYFLLRKQAKTGG